MEESGHRRPRSGRQLGGRCRSDAADGTVGPGTSTGHRSHWRDDYRTFRHGGRLPARGACGTVSTPIDMLRAGSGTRTACAARRHQPVGPSTPDVARGNVAAAPLSFRRPGLPNTSVMVRASPCSPSTRRSGLQRIRPEGFGGAGGRRPGRPPAETAIADPRAVVRSREPLASLAGTAWYVYRDGRYSPFAMGALVGRPTAARGVSMMRAVTSMPTSPRSISSGQPRGPSAVQAGDFSHRPMGPRHPGSCSCRAAQQLQDPGCLGPIGRWREVAGPGPPKVLEADPEEIERGLVGIDVAARIIDHDPRRRRLGPPGRPIRERAVPAVAIHVPRRARQ